jgi:hypothetical protein
MPDKKPQTSNGMSPMPYKDHPVVQIPLSLLKLPSYLARLPAVLILFVTILLLIGAFLLGYRVGPGLSIVQIGTVTLTELPAGTTIYVNEVLAETPRESEAVLKLIPGTHSVLLGWDEYYPWTELVEVPSGGQISLKPILIKKSAEEETLHDADRVEAERAIDELPLPTKEAPLVRYAGCVGIYVENGDLIASPLDPSCAPVPFLCFEGECGPTFVLPGGNEAVRAVIPFPGREDALIIALGQSIYAVEVDSRAPQFVAPILREHLPEIAPWNETSFVVRDRNAVFSVILP